MSGDVVLEDRKILVAFDSESGALTRLVYKTTGWVVERRPGLGISFRLLVPLPDRQYNFVLGQKQHATNVAKISPKEIAFEWNNLVSENGGVLRITLASTVTLTDGVLRFQATLRNNSRLTVQSIDYPYLGDVNPPSGNSSMSVRTMRYDNLESEEIYPAFRNAKGYWGVMCPIKTFASSYSLFCLVQSPGEGLYVEMESPNAPYLLEYTFEQHPGTLSSVTNIVPAGDVIGDKAVHLNFRTCHYVFAQPGSTVKMVPVVLQCYSGDWHAGVDLFKAWRKTWYKPAHLPEWVKDVHSWQQLQVNTPVQDYSIPYKELVKYGAECARNGVAAIQLVGWNLGGQDGGNPSFSTDPGLGRWQELHDAIQEIQAMGVRIVLFGKFPWADMTTDWYKNVLYKYATTDPYGIPYQSGGYSYLTPIQLAAINNHRFAVMDLLSPAYREIASNEFRKVLALNAAGLLYDEVCVQPPGHAYSFSPDHGYPAPGYIYSGAIPLAQRLHAAADSVNPDFLFAGEGPQDWLTQYYPVSYNRGSATPVERYIDPRSPIVVAVNGFDDRERLNLNLMERCITEYEPYNFKGGLTDFPLTLAYGKKIDSFRRRYRMYVWDADYCDTRGAEVTATGSFRYSVFVSDTGKRSVVVVNLDSRKNITAVIKLPNAGKLLAASPERPDPVVTSGTLEIPARSTVVIMEH